MWIFLANWMARPADVADSRSAASSLRPDGGRSASQSASRSARSSGSPSGNPSGSPSGNPSGKLIRVLGIDPGSVITGYGLDPVRRSAQLSFGAWSYPCQGRIIPRKARAYPCCACGSPPGAAAGSGHRAGIPEQQPDVRPETGQARGADHRCCIAPADGGRIRPAARQRWYGFWLR